MCEVSARSADAVQLKLAFHLTRLHVVTGSNALR
jgi:hypothetical protein